MVNVTPEEVEAMRRGERRLEEMSQMDRDISGADQDKHIKFPVGADIYNLRRISGLLHGFASSVEMLSRRRDIAARTRVLELRAEIDDLNRRIREMTGKGKRKKPWERDR